MGKSVHCDEEDKDAKCIDGQNALLSKNKQALIECDAFLNARSSFTKVLRTWKPKKIYKITKALSSVK